MARTVLCFAALFIAFSLAAQEVGMGRRRGSGVRYEAPYTLAVQTPHVKWANSLPGGVIHLLAVPTVSEGRTLVELAQRLSLDLTTVSIDPRFDVNKWTMGFGRDYGARSVPPLASKGVRDAGRPERILGHEVYGLGRRRADDARGSAEAR